MSKKELISLVKRMGITIDAMQGLIKDQTSTIAKHETTISALQEEVERLKVAVAVSEKTNLLADWQLGANYSEV